MIGNGSWDLINRLLQWFVKPGEEVLPNDPGWYGFDFLCPRYGITNRPIPFALTGPGNRPHHNLEGFLDAIGPKTRMIYLISPSNPVGVPL